jgi:hypothetical protein
MIRAAIAMSGFLLRLVVLWKPRSIKPMNVQRIIGLKPWLPGFLGRSPWWTEPIRAERLAAVRIGAGALLLVDILGMYVPRAGDFLGADSLGSPEVFAGRLSTGWQWSLMAGIADQGLWRVTLAVWALAAACLLVGIFPRLAAGVAWALALSVQNTNLYMHNAGDNVRNILLLYLLLTPCGAAWSVARWWERRTTGDDRPAYIHPWPVRLLLVQMMAIYLVNGLYKFSGEAWRSGEIMHQVLANVQFTRFSYEQLPLVPGAIAAMTWSTLVWELGFPLLLTLGMFPFYMLCLYLPFVPWEKWLRGTSFGGATLFIPRHARINLQAPGVDAAG